MGTSATIIFSSPYMGQEQALYVQHDGSPLAMARRLNDMFEHHKRSPSRDGFLRSFYEANEGCVMNQDSDYLVDYLYKIDVLTDWETYQKDSQNVNLNIVAIVSCTNTEDKRSKQNAPIFNGRVEDFIASLVKKDDQFQYNNPINNLISLAKKKYNERIKDSGKYEWVEYQGRKKATKDEHYSINIRQTGVDFRTIGSEEDVIYFDVRISSINGKGGSLLTGMSQYDSITEGHLYQIMNMLTQGIMI